MFQFKLYIGFNLVVNKVCMGVLGYEIFQKVNNIQKYLINNQNE